ncbi:MAG: glycosyltransferase family 39 protein [candidate division Zixibacteria bacterium]|nr:glycosyltransferase family 39 protein [candidate division Zixibacteria bacterium]
MNTHLLLVLSILCVAFNLTKAVHIDDTAYLEISRHILADPLRPMSGFINWYSSDDLIASVNQPHLPFYVYALVMALFGVSEWALHVVVSLTGVCAIWLFYRLALRCAPENADWLVVLFTLGPAFLPGQNLMVDTPLVLCWLAFFDLMTRPPDIRSSRHYALAAAALAAACLIKYTSVVLLPLFILTIGARRAYWMLGWIAIPAMTLSVWSLWNYLDYGAIHLLSREPVALTLKDWIFRWIEWFSGIGAMAPFALIALSSAWQVPRRRWIISAALLGGVGVTLHAHYPGAPYQIVLGWGLFFGAGCLLVGMTLSGAVNQLIAKWRAGDRVCAENIALLILWGAGVSVFIVSAAPFVAIRHILLIVPALLLLLGMQFRPGAGRALRHTGVALTATLGIAMSISDHVWAGVYRTQAGEIYRQLRSETQDTIWHIGHWGWQWYARKAGMPQYDTETSVLEPGDYVVVAETVHGQGITPAHREKLEQVSRIEIPSTPWTWVRLYNPTQMGGYYSFNYRWRALPWRFSNTPLETFTLYRVRGEMSSQERQGE